MGLAGFRVFGVDAVVADLRVGHAHDLSAIGWIGDDLLVSGHGGVETNFPGGGSGGSEGGSMEIATVFEGEYGGGRHGARKLGIRPERCKCSLATSALWARQRH